MTLTESLFRMIDRQRIYLRPSDGAVVVDTSLHREFPDCDFDLLHRCIEDNIVLDEDGSDDIFWSGVVEDYEAAACR